MSAARRTSFFRCARVGRVLAGISIWTIFLHSSPIAKAVSIHKKLSGDARGEFFAVQHVGTHRTAGSAFTQPRTPFDPNSRCLEAGIPTPSLDGIPTRFALCESSDLGHSGAIDAEKRERQEWSFTQRGQIRSRRYPDLCIRHTECGGSWMYDLGDCEDFEHSAMFQVNVRVRSTEEVSNVGRPLQALQQDRDCEVCGPYQLVHFCKDGQVEGSGMCRTKEAGEEEKAVAGWTRSRSQLVPKPDPNPGRSLFDLFSSEALLGKPPPSNGLKALTNGGVCHSFVGDGSAAESFFYFKKFL